VRGWRFAEEVACELQRQVEDDLRGLAEDRLLDRVSLYRDCRRRGHKLYRITEAGARALAERRGGEPATVTPPGPESDSERAALHLTAHAWLVLDSLVRRRLSGLGPGWKGEPGWMTGAEVHAAGGFVATDVDIGWQEQWQALDVLCSSHPAREPEPGAVAMAILVAGLPVSVRQRMRADLVRQLHDAYASTGMPLPGWIEDELLAGRQLAPAAGTAAVDA
jgi:hypothetical protein